MDLQAAKDLNTGMWLFARIGVVVCFGLAGILLASSLWTPANVRNVDLGSSLARMDVSPVSLSLPSASRTALPPG